MDAFFLNADLYSQRDANQAYRQKQYIEKISAHEQNKYQCDHAYARDHAEHTLPQTDLMVKDQFQPFFEHAAFPPLKYMDL